MHNVPSLAPVPGDPSVPPSDPPALWVHAEVLAHLSELPIRPWEVGGWLLGYWSSNRQSVYVTHATPPASRGTPFGVRISGDGHGERFDEAWKASAGHVTFVGDWHTHPGSPAIPSQRDHRALQQLSTDPDYGTPRPLAAIVRTPRWPILSSGPVEIRWHALLDMDALPIELSPRITHNFPESAASIPSWRWGTRNRNR